MQDYGMDNGLEPTKVGRLVHNLTDHPLPKFPTGGCANILTWKNPHDLLDARKHVDEGPGGLDSLWRPSAAGPTTSDAGWVQRNAKDKQQRWICVRRTFTRVHGLQKLTAALTGVCSWEIKS